MKRTFLFVILLITYADIFGLSSCLKKTSCNGKICYNGTLNGCNCSCNFGWSGENCGETSISGKWVGTNTCIPASTGLGTTLIITSSSSNYFTSMSVDFGNYQGGNGFVTNPASFSYTDDLAYINHNYPIINGTDSLISGNITLVDNTHLTNTYTIKKIDGTVYSCSGTYTKR